MRSKSAVQGTRENSERQENVVGQDIESNIGMHRISDATLQLIHRHALTNGIYFEPV